VIGLQPFWSIISDIYYDKPWGASSNIADDIRNEYRYGEWESGMVEGRLGNIVSEFFSIL